VRRPTAERLPVFLTGTMWDLQAELLKSQSELADRVGEPVLLGIRLVYDDWFEVEIGTFTERFGTAAGRDLKTAIEDAAAMLLEMDQVVAELRPAPD
jgi:hypothetical protein